MAIDKRTRQKLEAELTVLLKKGRMQRASLVLRTILEGAPDDDRLFVKLAEVSQKLGDEEGVRAAYRGAAAAAERKGFFLRAMAALRQLARHQQPADRPWSELSALALRLGLVGDALGFLDEGVRAWEVEGDKPAVLQALRRAHDLVPDDLPRTLRLAVELRRVGLVQEAVALLAAEARRHQAAGRAEAWLALSDERASLLPGDHALACEVAAAMLERDDPRRALARLQAVLRARPQHLEALRLLARAFEALGHASRRVAAVRALARALDATGRQAAARPEWEAVLAAAPGDAEALQALGPAAAPQPSPVLAAGPAQALPPAPPPGEAEDEIIDLATAGVELLEPPAAAPASADLGDELAHLDFLVAHRFRDEARALLAALEEAHPGHPGVAALRARLDAGPERVSAHPLATPATSLPPPELLRPPPGGEAGLPGEPVDLLLLGAVELDPADEAMARFREQVALQVEPDDAATHYDLGIACREMGLTAEAEAEFELAFGSARGPRAVDCLVGMAFCQAVRGDLGRASRTLKRALAHPALTPVGAAAVLYELGALREQGGDRSGAASAFRAAERSQPRFRDAAARAARLQPGTEPEDEATGLGLLPSRA
jgi:tetratricopeptide (TPR) repeat protein